MQGKHIAITGPTAGIGAAASRELARRGARLTLFCRNPEKARALQRDIEQDTGTAPAVILLDMADLSSVRRAAQEFLDSGAALDVLLNNAGVIHTSRHETVDGFEATLAVNHLAPFLLTGLLLPRLLHNPGARIVNTSSGAHAFVREMGFDDLQAKTAYRTFSVYGRSKLANLLFTHELARRLAGRDITVNALHPGAVSTSLGTQNGLLGRVLPALLRPFFRTPEKGAETSIYLCCSDAVAGTSGGYFYNCKPLQAKPWARDDNAAARLWEVSEDCVDFTYPV